jgi:hypothetical protein
VAVSVLEQILEMEAMVDHLAVALEVLLAPRLILATQGQEQHRPYKVLMVVPERQVHHSAVEVVVEQVKQEMQTVKEMVEMEFFQV